MFDWKDFIDLSEELLNSNMNFQKKEALYRTIVSRSYYGVFKQVENVLEDRGVNLRTEDSKGRRRGSHEKVIDYLQNHKHEELKDFGKHLDYLKGLRITSDYRRNKEVSRKDAEEALRLAKKLSDKWKEYKSLVG